MGHSPCAEEEGMGDHTHTGFPSLLRKVCHVASFWSAKELLFTAETAPVPAAGLSCRHSLRCRVSAASASGPGRPAAPPCLCYCAAATAFAQP